MKKIQTFTLIVLSFFAFPLLAGGNIKQGERKLLRFNPKGHHPYILRSEPEGLLFPTQTKWVTPGTKVKTETYNPDTTPFAYWTVDGVKQINTFGIAQRSATWTMPSKKIEIIAHCFTNKFEQMSLHWYGKIMPAESDTDNDGYTLEEEIKHGLNPVFPNKIIRGGATLGD